MAKKNVEKENSEMIDIEDISSLEVDNDQDELKVVEVKKVKRNSDNEDLIYNDAPLQETISCLKNEKITVRYIPRESGMITNPKHVFYGGLAENSVLIFTVPVLESNGQYVNVLTNQEKSFLEEYMGLPYNALSIYKKNDNYWDNYQVRLSKGDTILDLSNPNDYIKYKVLLSNKDFVAPSIETLQDYPKATYKFVIISEQEEIKTSKVKLNSTMEAYKEFGKYENDYDTLRVVVEMLTLRPMSSNTKIEFLQTQIDRLIQSDPKLFVKTIKDPYLSTKVLIKNAIDAGIISKRGDYLYLKQDNTPLCENNQEPTLSSAAKYLNSPKRQEIKFMIEAKLNK